MSTDLATMTPRSRAASGDVSEKTMEVAHESREFKIFGKDGFTFYDFLDMVNPLQHIPIVGALYREWTGDQIDPGSRIAGGALFGGPIGLGAAIANVWIERESGKDMGEHVMASLFDGDEARDGKPENYRDQDRAEPDTRPPWSNAVIDGFRAAEAEADARLRPASQNVVSFSEQKRGRNAPPRSAGTPAGGGNAWHDDVLWAFRKAGEQADGAGDGHDWQTATTDAATKRLTGARAYGKNVPAAEGGWFTEVMLDALRKYNDSAMPAENTRIRSRKTVSMTREGP